MDVYIDTVQPWRVKYRRIDPPGPTNVLTVLTPNDYLIVQERGTYKLLEVTLFSSIFGIIDITTFTGRRCSVPWICHRLGIRV